jgi:hypothetical protein
MREEYNLDIQIRPSRVAEGEYELVLNRVYDPKYSSGSIERMNYEEMWRLYNVLGDFFETE